jgi:hypothetical protein
LFIYREDRYGFIVNDKWDNVAIKDQVSNVVFVKISIFSKTIWHKFDAFYFIEQAIVKIF